MKKLRASGVGYGGLEVIEAKERVLHIFKSKKNGQSANGKHFHVSLAVKTMQVCIGSRMRKFSLSGVSSPRKLIIFCRISGLLFVE